MYAVSIHDLDKQVGSMLAFDLIDLLKLYQSEVLNASWDCSDIWCIQKMGNEADHEDWERDKVMSGDDLLNWAERCQQVIDGNFIGTRAGEDSPSLVFRAEDSTYYVVIAKERDLLTRLSEHFEDVRDSPTWAEQYA